MITVLKPTQTKKDVPGAVLFGGGYIDLHEEMPEEMFGVPTCFLDSFDTFLGLKSVLDIDLTELRTKSLYKCPSTGNLFYGVLPVGISFLTPAEIDKCKTVIPVTDYDFWEDELSLCDNNLVHAQMGHGYTDANLPHDGGSEVQLGTIKLSDGRLLYVNYFVWFNK